MTLARPFLPASPHEQNLQEFLCIYYKSKTCFINADVKKNMQYSVILMNEMIFIFIMNFEIEKKWTKTYALIFSSNFQFLYFVVS